MAFSKLDTQISSLWKMVEGDSSANACHLADGSELAGDCRTFRQSANGNVLQGPGVEKGTWPSQQSSNDSLGKQQRVVCIKDLMVRLPARQITPA